MVGKVLVISWKSKVDFIKGFKTPCECGGELSTRYYHEPCDSLLKFSADGKLQTESISIHCVCNSCAKRKTVILGFLAGEALDAARAIGQSTKEILSTATVQCQEGWK